MIAAAEYKEMGIGAAKKTIGTHANKISRLALPVSKGIAINGLWRNGGEVYAFHDEPGYQALFSNPAPWALSWTTLPDGKDLDPHYHPFESYVAIVQGRALLTGLLPTSSAVQPLMPVEAGQLVQIPPWCLHGFRCQTEKPFWALSWQRSKKSLFFEDEISEVPAVIFPGDPAESQRLASPESVTILNGRTEGVPGDSLPQFRFYEFAMDRKKSIQFARNGLLFVTSSKVQVELNGAAFELIEGDALPLYSGQSIVATRQDPTATIATLQF